jgi:hypothetical protein
MNTTRSCRHLIAIAAMVLYLTSGINAQVGLPKIVYPSPENSHLFRFQDYPMDYSTGLPQISIPVYEVKSGPLSVPISISYHASGRRVSDQDGPVAVGWALNAGGVISRTIHGSADFGSGNRPTYNFPYPFKVDNLSNSTDLEYLEKIMHYGIFNNQTEPDINLAPWYDSEYDIFSYSFDGNSGKFFFKDENGVKTPVLLPYKPFRIVPTPIAGGLDKIEITDDKGTTYLFVQGERYSDNSDNAISSWLLTKITSADKTDEISFGYTLFTEQRVSINQSIVLIDNWTATGASNPPADYLTYPENTIRENYTVSRLTSINFKNGKVLFNLASGTYVINNMQILNAANEVLKTIDFNRSICYSQAELGYATTKLNSLVFKDNTGAAAETYSFEYYPLASNNDQVNARYCDWWGYYNNSQVHDMVPHYTNLQFITPGNVTQSYEVGNAGANREPELQALKSGVLKKITYPTGGSTEFIYEHNQCTLYGSNNSPRKGPGLRVYQIKTTDNCGAVSMRTFKYGVNESGYGAIEMLPQLTNMGSESNYFYINPQVWATTCFSPDGGPITYRQRTFFSGFKPELGELASRPVIYPEVTEYIGDETNNIGKTVYQYDPYAMWVASPMQIFSQTTIYPMHIYDWNYWNTPSLQLKTDYKRVRSSSAVTYEKVKEASYSYQNTVTEYVRGLHVQRVNVYPQAGRECSTGYWAEKFAVVRIAASLYSFADYRIPVGYKVLTGANETLYNDDGSIVSNGSSNEFNSYLLVKKTTQATSDGSAHTTEIKYPFDYTGDATLSQMVSLNMLNFPVEQHEFRNTTPIKSIRNNYYNWGSSIPMINLKSIDLRKGANGYETRLKYLNYDEQGNPLSVTKEQDAPVSYVWDYNKIYPVAEVKNAVASDIAFTSFEADGTGNWTGINASNMATGNTITGSRFYNFNGSVLSKSNLNTNNAYIVSYWSNNGMYTVSGTSASGWPKQIKTVAINGVNWTCWEHKVSGAAAVSVSGSGGIDELRLYPANAMMTSFSFKPLIGMTNQNDANNSILYYEYDAYGRLKLIRDLNYNIIKTFNYQYQSAAP